VYGHVTYVFQQPAKAAWWGLCNGLTCPYRSHRLYSNHLENPKFLFWTFYHLMDAFSLMAPVSF